MSDQRVFVAARVFLRVALGISFIVPTCDRLGVFGPYGSRNVAWGDWSHFVKYVAVLNWFVPTSLIPGLAIVETVIEFTLGIALVLGIFQREVGWSSAALLLAFAVTMTVALGILAPMSYSVFTAAAGAMLLATSITGPGVPESHR